ncbi:hypothetical protein [Salipiger sp. PrR003]|uniref:hypothetical protein n=1 Tax=Salipiger sp. PrR003 TaxID=2706776 RepID=UPI0013D9444F|nr:hypothetical protein [Salipiger sp. PrR003]NDV52867.1 hypothetical protein [Salipiger sp. PrR003]
MANDAKITELEGLKAKHRDLERQKMAADAEISQHKRTLAELIKEMKDKFGVETVEDLRNLYEELQEEDAKKIAEFRGQIEAITESLAALQEDA